MDSLKLLYTLEQPHGLGELYFKWQNGESKSFLATTGTDATLAIHDRHGQLKERMRLQGLCASMEWDSEGDFIAAITPSSHSVLLWECHTNKRLSIDTGLKEAPSCIAWASGEPLLAVGTQRGNLALYNHHTTKRTPIIGKHSKKITCAVWNKDNILALASEDKTLSVNNVDGDTLRVITLRDQPNDLQFSEMKTDERIGGDNTISLVVGKRTLYLYNLADPENPIELAFQSKYGSIITYKWYGDGYILIGFSSGYLIAISTHIKEVGQELFQVKTHKENLTDIAMCNRLSQAASCGDNQFKIYSVWNNSEVLATVTPPGGAEMCSWSFDGQLLAVSGRSYLNVYIASLPPLFSAHNTRICALTSLAEATIFQCIAIGETGEPMNKEPYAITSYALPSEPDILALGSNHLGCVNYNTAWYFQLLKDLQTSSPTQRSYPGAVKKIVVGNEYAAAMFDGKVLLHLIDTAESLKEDKESRLFPCVTMQDSKLTDLFLTGDFLIIASDTGYLLYFGLDEWNFAVRYKHSCGIQSIHSDISGTRLVFMDEKQKAFVFNPITDEIVQIEDFPTACKGVLWDICVTERNVFVCYNQEMINTYYFAPRSIHGSHVDFVSSTKIVGEATPLILFSGEVYCYSPGGSVTTLTLNSHNTSGLADVEVEKRLENQRIHLEKTFKLRRLAEACLFCEAIEENDYWLKLGKVAIENLDVEFAIRVYTRLGDVAMVWALEDAAESQDLSSLCARLCACAGEVERACAWAEGTDAVSCAAAGLQWRRATELATVHAPHLLPGLTASHAQQLEYTGDYHDALINYEKALINDTSNKDEQTEAHNEKCLDGIARTAVRCGDIARAISLALRSPPGHTRAADCAMLLEDCGQKSQAASLYEHAGQLEKAAALYIELKSWLKVESLLPKITAPKIHSQYAKAKEAEGRYGDAQKAYIRAKDYDSAVRLNLEKLKDPDEAVRLVQESKSVQGARMVADYFQKCNDTTSAIKFLVMSLCYEEAFQLAKRHGKLQTYGEMLIEVTSQARPDDFKSLANHFEAENNHLLAGKFYFYSKEYSKSMNHLTHVSNGSEGEEEALSLAIDAVASSNDEILARKLIDFLLGELDGIPRDPKFLFKLYMARKQFNEASKTALIISGQEQAAGNYRAAHSLLTGLVRAAGGYTAVGLADARRELCALHTYSAARRHARSRHHARAARLLVRLASEHLHSFPAHVVPILTSTVIECSKAGLKKSAYRYARTLMKPEYRAQLDSKYAKKIESVIRHPPKEESEPKEDVTPCPYCDYELPETLLTCINCQEVIPFCIATACHIVKDDLTVCPECDFPAIRSELIEIINEDGHCPMCLENIEERQLLPVQDVSNYLLSNNIVRKS